jgi:hypothetical protein
MTDRTFVHRFTYDTGHTRNRNALGLSPAEIAAAAMQEITQLSLNAAPFNLFLDGLLDPETTRFKWVSQLGQVRETRTALSGLFGRFVARAYLTRYQGFGYFEPIRSETQLLSGWPSFRIRRKRGITGDLPDWMVAPYSGATGVAVAEAKGSYNTSGPWPSLEAARTQVGRVDVTSGRTVLRVKRFAVATRWAIQGSAPLSVPWLVVHDPEDGGRLPTPEENDNLARSTALGHFASLARGFGLPLTAAALHEAKVREPGRLSLPEDEMLAVEIDGREAQMIGAVAASVGVLPIPRTASVTDFLAAVRTVHGDRTLFFGVHIEILLRIDQGKLRWDEVSPPTGLVDDLFSRAIRVADGAEISSLQRIAVRRLTPS